MTQTNMPIIPTGQELYDQLMGQIEPDLVSSAIPTLKEKYVQETPEEKEQRRQRYNAAYEKYEEAYQAFMADLNHKVQMYQKESMRSIEAESKQDDEEKLGGIEASLLSS